MKKLEKKEVISILKAKRCIERCKLKQNDDPKYLGDFLGHNARISVYDLVIMLIENIDTIEEILGILKKKLAYAEKELHKHEDPSLPAFYSWLSRTSTLDVVIAMIEDIMI